MQGRTGGGKGENLLSREAPDDSPLQPSPPQAKGRMGECDQQRRRGQDQMPPEPCPRDHPRPPENTSSKTALIEKASPSQAKIGDNPARVLRRWKLSHSCRNFVKGKQLSPEVPGSGGWPSVLPTWTGAQKT